MRIRQRHTDGVDLQIDQIAMLGDPVRRALYRYVAGQHDAVSREQAAEAAGVPQHTAKFHLDKLEAAGLLRSEYSRPPGRRGPGAGRPAKRYRRSPAIEVSVTLPARRYDLAARVMARAIAAAAASGGPITGALRDAALAEGHALGERAIARLGADPDPDPDPDPAGRTEAITGVLADEGYQPQAAGDTITLTNCPFHALAQERPELVCGMNLDLIRGLLEAVRHSGLRPRLEHVPGRCCISLDHADPDFSPATAARPA